MAKDRQDGQRPRVEPSELRELRTMVAFLEEKERHGIVSPEDFEQIILTFLAPLGAQGYLDPDLDAEALRQLAPEQQAATRGVMRHAVHQMKRQFLTLYPQLAGELNTVLGAGPSR